MPHLTMPTAFRLSEVLATKGLSQAALARASGVAIRTISRLCRNETAQVSLATLDKLAAALGVEPGDLIAREKARRKK